MQSGFTDVGRDGCRVPLPWSDCAAPYGFSPGGSSARPWLPQPPHWETHTAEMQAADPNSFLTLYRSAVRTRRLLWENAGPAEWMSAPAGVLAFARGGAQCWVNTGADDVELPANVTLALSSTPGVTGCVPPDTTVWLVEG